MPFDSEQFFDVFQSYNSATSGPQWVLLAMCFFAIALIIWHPRHSDVAVAVILAALWAWTGLVYHILFFWKINPAAIIFGSTFLIQAALFLFFADRLKFKIGRDSQSWFGITLLFYLLVVYPLIGELVGQHYTRRPGPGTPCPTTIFTFGVLLFLRTRPPFYVYMIPFLWSLLGATAAYFFGVYQDLGLLVAGVGGSFCLYSKNGREAA